MKHLVYKLTALFLLLSLSCPLIGCLPSGNATPAQPITDHILPLQAFDVQAAPELTQFGQGMTDDTYNYFCFKLGVTKNVPLYYENGYQHNGTLDSTYKWESRSISATAYEEAIESSSQVSTTTKSSISFSTSLSSGITASYGGLKAETTAKLESNLSQSLSTSYSTATKDSFTHTMQNKLEESRSRTISIPASAPRGYYRYVMYADFDVYVALLCHIESRTVEYAYLSVPRKASIFDTFHYSEKNDFSDFNPAQTLPLTPDMFSTLSLDLFERGLSNKVPNYEYAKLGSKPLYTNGTDRTITDDGYYGLCHVDQGDYIHKELAPFAHYMHAGYTFCFTISIEAETKGNIFGSYDGYHELHLYKQENSKTNRNLNDTVAAQQYGWLAKAEWTSDGTKDFHFYIRGDQFSQEKLLVLLYDARGKGEDTWKVKHVTVNLSIYAADAPILSTMP